MEAQFSRKGIPRRVETELTSGLPSSQLPTLPSSHSPAHPPHFTTIAQTSSSTIHSSLLPQSLPFPLRHAALGWATDAAAVCRHPTAAAMQPPASLHPPTLYRSRPRSQRRFVSPPPSSASTPASFSPRPFLLMLPLPAFAVVSPLPLSCPSSVHKCPASPFPFSTFCALAGGSH